jgi:hypothetical protein
MRFLDKSKFNIPDIKISKESLANWIDATKAGIGIGVNNIIAKRALDVEKPFLQEVVEGHRTVYGDYRQQKQGE